MTQEGTALRPPYAPSWFDRHRRWVERLRVPPWAFYVLMLLATILYVHVVLWLNGKGDFLRPNLMLEWIAIPFVYGLWLIGYLDRRAARALRDFRPALTASDAEYARMEYELTTMPARPVWWATLVGVVLNVAYFAFPVPDIVAEYGPSAPVNFVLFGWILGLSFVMSMIGLYHTYRQLRLISVIQAQATRVNLYHPRPLHAFSFLSAQTAIGMIVVLPIIFIGSPAAMLASPISGVLTLLFPFLAVAAFVLPLRGMHDRLVAEKHRLQSEASARFEAVIARLHEHVDANSLTDIDGLNKAVASLAIERDAIDKLSTWPWARGTLTTVITALALPLALWLITRLIDRLVIVP